MVTAHSNCVVSTTVTAKSTKEMLVFSNNIYSNN